MRQPVRPNYYLHINDMIEKKWKMQLHKSLLLLNIHFYRSNPGWCRMLREHENKQRIFSFHNINSFMYFLLLVFLELVTDVKHVSSLSQVCSSREIRGPSAGLAQSILHYKQPRCKQKIITMCYCRRIWALMYGSYSMGNISIMSRELAIGSFNVYVIIYMFKNGLNNLQQIHPEKINISVQTNGGDYPDNLSWMTW